MLTDLDQYQVRNEPYYRAVSDEVELYEAAYLVRMPMMLKARLAVARRALWSTWRGNSESR